VALLLFVKFLAGIGYHHSCSLLIPFFRSLAPGGPANHRLHVHDHDEKGPHQSQLLFLFFHALLKLSVYRLEHQTDNNTL
jgi:hypothetical protein